MAAYAIERDPLLADERPHTLARRVEEVLSVLATVTGMPCVCCATTVCAHDALASLVLGFQREPRCTDCLARATARAASILRAELTAFVLGKECLTVGWRWARAHESACDWFEAGALHPGDAPTPDASAAAQRAVTEPDYDAEWNAGDLACGELVLELSLRLRRMSPGSTIKVTARDPAAPEDMPAWCRLTGHRLAYAAHPYYFIRRKEG
jgi:tRNA 2-thiouridine synthesizing protein A